MEKKRSRAELRLARRIRIRKQLKGTNTSPRLSVFKSNLHIYAQLIDDTTGTTLAHASTQSAEFKAKQLKTNSKEAAKIVGELIAEKALSKGVKTVVFDRGGYPYHGKVEVLASAAREKGLVF